MLATVRPVYGASTRGKWPRPADRSTSMSRVHRPPDDSACYQGATLRTHKCSCLVCPRYLDPAARRGRFAEAASPVCFSTGDVATLDQARNADAAINVTNGRATALEQIIIYASCRIGLSSKRVAQELGLRTSSVLVWTLDLDTRPATEIPVPAAQRCLERSQHAAAMLPDRRRGTGTHCLCFRGTGLCESLTATTRHTLP